MTISIIILAVLLIVFVILTIVMRNLFNRKQVESDRFRGLSEEKDKWLNTVMNMSNDFIVLLKPVKNTFQIIQLPDHYLQKIKEHAGYDEAYMIGATLRTLYDEVLHLSGAEKKWRYEKYWQVVHDRQEREYEEILVNPDASKELVRTRCTPLVSGEQVEYLLVVSHNIAREKSQQLQIDRTQSLFETLLRKNPAGIMVFDSLGKIQLVNEKFTEYFGYSQEEITGADARVIVPKEYQKLLKQVRKKLAKHPMTYQFGREEALMALRKDGSTFHCELTITPVRLGAETLIITTMLDVSSYISAQQRLRESREQLRSLIDNLPGMVYRVNGESPYQILYISDRSKEIFGLSPEEIEEKGILPRDVFDKEYHHELKAKAIETLATGKKQEAIVKATTPLGQKWLMDRFKAVTFEDGTKVLDGLIIDVTESIEDQERLRSAVESVEQGMWDWNIPEKRVTANNFQSEMLGYMSHEIEENFDWWAAQIYPDDQKVIYDSIVAHLKGDSEYFECEYRFMTKQGKYKWILVRGKVIEWNMEGRAVRLIGTHLDINERKQMELRLMKSQDRLLRLMANIPGMVYRCRADGNYALSFASDGARALTGYDNTAFMNHHISVYEMIKPAYREEYRQAMLLAKNEKKAYELIYEIEVPDNASKWVYDKGNLISKGFVEGIITDITDRVKSEEKIIQTIIETEDRERRRIAEELHDNLGQKLTTASLNINALKNKFSDDQLNQRLQNGLKYLKKAMADTREISHNLMPKIITDFGLEAALRNMVNDINAAGGVQFHLYYKIDKPLSQSVATHLYRMVQESVNNIIRHAGATDAHIQLMCYDDSLVLTVEDNGQGFERDGLSDNKIFGLNSLRHRALLLSGHCEVASKPGKGTTITIELPAKTEYFNVEDTTD